MSSAEGILLQLRTILSEDYGAFMMIRKKEAMAWLLLRAGSVP